MWRWRICMYVCHIMCLRAIVDDAELCSCITLKTGQGTSKVTFIPMESDFTSVETGTCSLVVFFYLTGRRQSISIFSFVFVLIATVNCNQDSENLHASLSLSLSLSMCV